MLSDVINKTIMTEKKYFDIPIEGLLIVLILIIVLLLFLYFRKKK